MAFVPPSGYPGGGFLLLGGSNGLIDGIFSQYLFSPVKVTGGVTEAGLQSMVLQFQIFYAMIQQISDVLKVPILCAEREVLRAKTLDFML